MRPIGLLPPASYVAILALAVTSSGCTRPAGARQGVTNQPQVPPGAATLPSKIAFDAERVFVTQLTTGTPVPVTADDGALRYGACWSPDGRSLCFTVEPPEDRGGAGLALAGVDGGYGRRLTYPPAGRDESPDWSPRADRIVFARGTGSSGSGIATVDPSTGEVRVLVRGPHLRSPSWSADGSRIVYSAGATPERSWLYVVPAAGGSPRALDIGGSEPDWCPTGSRIAYEARGGVWTVAVDEAGSRRNKPSCLVPPSPRSSKGHPSWSPDGHRVAFHSLVLTDRGWERRIMTVAANGTDLRCVARGERPSWSPSLVRGLRAKGLEAEQAPRPSALGRAPEGPNAASPDPS